VVYWCAQVFCVKILIADVTSDVFSFHVCFIVIVIHNNFL
jgi:hypothetical protein